MEIDNIQDGIIDEFEQFRDKSHRFRYFRKLVQIGNELEPIPQDELSRDIMVRGSRSKIWIKARLENGKVFFTAYTKNLISKGLIGLLLRVFSGRSPKEIINSNLYFPTEINLYDRLNAEWLKDLLSVMQKIKSLAAALQLSSAV